MYSIVLATVLTASPAVPDFGRKGCYGCWGCGGCYGACYGACYGCGGGWGCSGWGCSGWGCRGYGGWSASYGSGWGCSGWGYGGCCGSCFGGCCGSWGWGYPMGQACWGGSGYGCSGWAGAGYGCSGLYSGGCYGVPAAPLYKQGPDKSAMPDKPLDKPDEDKDDKGKKKKKDDDGDEVSAPATVVVKAAQDVSISFNGYVTTRKSEEETFQTPELQPGRTYAYQVKAEALRDGKKVVLNKRILVRAGGRSNVDFSDLASVAAESEGASARVTVLLPSGTRLFVDGKAYGTTSKQSFTTPKLEKGKAYYYTVKVERTEDGKAESRRVNVQAGKEVTVDFRSSRSVVSTDR